MGGGVAAKRNLANDWPIVKCVVDAMATQYSEAL